MSNNIRFRLEDLATVLEAVNAVRPDLNDKALKGELTAADAIEVREKLMTLYQIIGSSAELYAETLRIAIERIGNVSRINNFVDRRRGPRKRVA